MANSDIVLHYDTCKNLALTQYRIRPENLSLLNTLKEKYKREINSPRRYEQISDLESLFNILEKRSALSLVDIHVLEEIYSILKINKGILENYKNLIKGKTSVTNRKRPTGEDIENREPPNNSSHRDSTSTHKFSDNFQSANPFENRNSNRQRLSERVVTEISTRIGCSWQELARYLKVQECRIHGISQDTNLSSNEAKTRAMLQEYQRRIDPVDMKTKLVKALELAGRKDLRHDIEKLFLREI